MTKDGKAFFSRHRRFTAPANAELGHAALDADRCISPMPHRRLRRLGVGPSTGSSGWDAHQTVGPVRQSLLALHGDQATSPLKARGWFRPGFLLIVSLFAAAQNPTYPLFPIPEPSPPALVQVTDCS